MCVNFPILINPFGHSKKVNASILTLSFKDVNGHLGATTAIALTITAHAGKQIMTSLSEEITFGDDAIIVVADEINSVFFHDDITAVTNAISV